MRRVFSLVLAFLLSSQSYALGNKEKGVVAGAIGAVVVGKIIEKARSSKDDKNERIEYQSRYDQPPKRNLSWEDELALVQAKCKRLFPSNDEIEMYEWCIKKQAN